MLGLNPGIFQTYLIKHLISIAAIRQADVNISFCLYWTKYCEKRDFNLLINIDNVMTYVINKMINANDM